MDYGHIYSDYWSRYLEAARRLDRTKEALEGEERRTVGGEAIMLAFDRGPRDSLSVWAHDQAQEIASSLFRCAQSEFAPAGQTFEIDESTRGQLREEAGLPRDRWEFDPDAFSPQAMWDALEARFGGGAGINEANRQLADRLVRAFRLRPDSEIKRTAGKVALNKEIFLEERLGNGDLSVHCRQDVEEAFWALAQFAEQQGYGAAYGLLLRTCRDLTTSFRPIQSRERFNLEVGELITFKKRFEFRLNEGFATELQAFLTTNATAFQNQEAA